MKLEQSAKIIAEVIKDKSILKELNGQIAKKLSITKSEEALTFKELFEEPDSRKVASTNTNNSKLFTMDASIANRFKVRYQEIAKNKTYAHPEKYAILEKSNNLKTQSLQPIEDMLTIDGAELYFPFSDNFKNVDYNPTITSHPINENEGNDGYYWDVETASWQTVWVNEDYAFENPSYIVTLNDGPTPEQISSKMIDGVPFELIPNFGIQDDSTPPFINPTTIQGSRVYFGRFHLEQQAEGFLDGASEITFVQPSATPSLNADGTLNTATFVANGFRIGKLRRGYIRRMRNNHEKNTLVGGTFTNEWLPINSNLPMIIYEYDQGGNFEMTIPSLKFKILGAEVTTPSTIKYNIRSKSNPYVIESVSRAFYGQYSNIKNPAIDPGQYDNWRSWGLQSCNVTLVTEGNWVY